MLALDPSHYSKASYKKKGNRAVLAYVHPPDVKRKLNSQYL